MKLRRILELWPLLVLCLLLSTRWMLADPYPGTVSTVSSEATAALLAAVAWIVLARREQQAVAFSRGELATGSLAGALLLGGLHAGFLIPILMPKSSEVLMAFSLTPIVIAVALVARGDVAGGLSGTELLPGLLAGTGLLLLLPQPLLSSFAVDSLLLLAPVCVGLAAVWLGGRAESPLSGRRMAAAFVGATFVFGPLAFKSPRVAPALAATGLDLLTLVLTLLALRKCGAQQFGAQFAAVPFLLLLEGLVFSRVLPNWLQAGGLLLLLLAALLLFRRVIPLRQEQTIRLLT